MLSIGRVFLTGEKFSKKNLPKYYFVHRKSHVVWVGIEIGPSEFISDKILVHTTHLYRTSSNF
jgi:hypothetical protein